MMMLWRRYEILASVLALVTVTEWLAYLCGTVHGLGRDYLVPLLLAVSAAKFAAVVAWFATGGTDPGWIRKALLVVLVLGGGAVILTRLQLG